MFEFDRKNAGNMNPEMFTPAEPGVLGAQPGNFSPGR